MAAPLPALRTPLRLAGNPSQSRRIARSVPKPMPAGSVSSQMRSDQAMRREKASADSGWARRAWATKTV